MKSEFKKGNILMKSCYPCRLAYMQNKNKENNENNENKYIVCKTCNEKKVKESFKKDDKIFDNCYECRVKYIKTMKQKNETQTDKCHPLMNEFNNYYLLRYKLLRISLNGSSFGRVLPSMDWIKYSEYDVEIKQIERKYDFIKTIYDDYSIRNISCDWYNSISSRNLDVWDISTWNEVKVMETLYFQVRCYHELCNKQIKLKLLNQNYLMILFIML